MVIFLRILYVAAVAALIVWYDATTPKSEHHLGAEVILFSLATLPLILLLRWLVRLAAKLRGQDELSSEGTGLTGDGDAPVSESRDIVIR